MSNPLVSPLGLRLSRGQERALFGLVMVAGALALYTGYQLLFGAASPWQTYTFCAAAPLVLTAVVVRALQHRYGRFFAIGFGVAFIAAGVPLLKYESEQVRLYNEAMVALDKHDLPAAAKLLDESTAAYKRETARVGLLKLILPGGRRDIEARVHNHKGVILVQQRKVKEAVKEFFTSLQVNPGNQYVGLSAEDAALWYNDSVKPKSNLEKLYRMGQANGQAKGRGQGRPGQQPGPPDRQPGQDPSNSNGRKGPGKL